MTLLIISFIAGVLTVLAPCIIPILPAVISRSISNTENNRSPYIIIGSLAISILLFTLILKASIVLISVPDSFWRWFSGGILFSIGFFMIFPLIWEKISMRLKLSSKSNNFLISSTKKKGLLGDIFIGIALGPVFSSCSPTYFIILATVLPESFWQGIIYLIVYIFGFSIVLLLLVLAGKKIVKNIKWALNPQGWFKRSLGILFLIIGFSIILGIDKKIETALLSTKYINFTNIEYNLLEKIDFNK